jgi:hypothetical protein
MLYSFKKESVPQVKKEKAMGQLLREHHRVTLILSEPERITLEEAVAHHPHPDARERAAALLQVAQGRCPHWVALHGLLQPQWLHYYEQAGIAALFHRRHGGPHRRRLRSLPTDPRAIAFSS